ncbi:hypothetical protein ZWY2020_018412 [Hordeum vulgare]|nr:hypothetical protein ZWY2020_018412 [Hordeum vulgare]
MEPLLREPGLFPPEYDKDIVDGLVCVDSEEVIAAMVNASKEAKTLLVIVDEENKIRKFYEDVIIDGPLCQK